MANKMEDCDESKGWEEMIPDALGLIFQKLSLQEILTVVPRVCKSWERAASGPYCWQEIDLEEWSQDRPTELVDRMLHELVTRSSGSLRKLSVSGLSDDRIFSFIADHAGSLQSLEIPRSEISDSIVEQFAGRFSNVTFLDISYCMKIGADAIFKLGKHCKCLVELRRLMDPLDLNKVSRTEEAYAIADSMPKLKRLELAYSHITTKAVLEILSACKDLEYLNIEGCWDVKLDQKSLKETSPCLKVDGPLIFWDHMLHYSDSSDYLSWEFMHDDGGEYNETSDDEDLWNDEQGLEPFDRLLDDGLGLEPLVLNLYDGGYDDGYDDGYDSAYDGGMDGQYYGHYGGIEWPPSD